MLSKSSPVSALMAVALLAGACGSSPPQYAPFFHAEWSVDECEPKRAIEQVKKGGRHICAVIDGEPTAAEIREIAKRNQRVHGDIYKKEREALHASPRGDAVIAGHRWPNNRPRMCLALSGGGLRAAAFSIGILEGLHGLPKGWIEKLDVISAVSGGSYALAWYLAAQSRNPEAADKLFTDPQLVERLAEKAEFVNQSAATARFAIFGLFKSAVDIVYRGLTGLNRPTLNHSYYEHRLREVFELDVDSGWEGVRQAILAKRLPLPIFNASATAADPEDGEPVPTDGEFAHPQRIFEISPFRHGSEELKFVHDRDPPFALAGAAAISGAAVDERYGPGASLFSKVRGGLGFTYDATKGWKWDRGRENLKVLYLSDGGFAENLGAYTLIKRMCEEIVIVDSTEDPDLELEGYWRLKAILKQQLKADFSVPALEALGGRVQMSRFPLSPVLDGTIGKFPWIDRDGTATAVSTPVRYVKLAWNERWIAESSEKPVTDLFAKVQEHIRRCNEKPTDKLGMVCRFPHDPTRVTSYEPSQFLAYRALGHGIVRGFFMAK